MDEGDGAEMYGSGGGMKCGGRRWSRRCMDLEEG